MKKMIYVVDDEKQIRDICSRALRGRGYDTSEFNDARDCASYLSKTTEDNPDLVITDNDMEEWSGIMLIEYMRYQEKLKDIPVLLMSGRGDNIESQIEHDVKTEFLSKPFKIHQLYLKVTKLLRE